ncbi:MAG: glycosyl hydrolase [Flavobacteriia bacterium]|nr:glycosyl hydrolase [Flavobacteriia bacterium]
MYKLLFFALFVSSICISQKNKPIVTKPVSLFDASTVSALSFRLVGPALTSGRVVDLAIHPTNNDQWYVAAACGGVWQTNNHGITFSPIFDGQGSFSIACVELAPSNPNTLWVGTGENNNQRSVAYGDGVYKSLDGGKSFTNMGLKNSEHIGNIIIHPTNENILWVAAYGPLWKSGGERGVYKSIDGGKTWERTLFVSENTGISEIAIDPSNPSILYAAAHQRRRHEWTYIGGGPESTLYKSTDGGLTWREIKSGLPAGDMGRIGLAVSESDANYVYAIIEGRYGKGGVYRSVNKGESWSKQGDYNTSGNYYQEIFVDPMDKNKVFAMDTYMHHSEDGGKTFKPTGEKNKHVDNHCIWIDPKNTNHWIAGCDGGVYETYTHAKEWKYYANLPIIQFYKVTTDNAAPFYNIFGGTQDNNSMGGPSATNNAAGILNSDWYITNGGDGFESATDWSNNNIVYAQAQHGWLVRYDKASGEKVPIQPMPGKGEEAYRWNWDAPLIVSSHDASTLYFAANKLFKSTNKGDDWQVVSPDLSQQIDRNKLEVMDQVWTIDAVMKNASTTIYGNVIALDESPKKKGLLYVGTDDGLIQVSENDGGTWTKYNVFLGVPANTRVNMLTASLHDENTVYVAFNSQRQGDFKPYLFTSNDKGKTWTSISSNLPERGNVYCIKQDHVDPNLLFVGTEFGAYFSNDNGKVWTKISGLPITAVYDLDIQKRENDLVAATFGRGFYVLDNYSPLRSLTKENLDKKAFLFPVKPALQYVPADPLGLDGTGFQGHNMWAASNPTFGATFSLYIKDEYKTLKDIRQEKEKALEKEKKDVFYPTFDELRKEALDEAANLIWVITDQTGKEIRRLTSSPTKGIVRMSWNLRSNSSTSIGATSNGFLVKPGNYFISISLVQNGLVEELITKQSFTVNGLNNQTLLAKDPADLVLFRNDVAALNQKINNASNWLDEVNDVLQEMQSTLINYPNTELSLLSETRALKLLYDEAALVLWGDKIKSSREFETLPSINDRMGMVEYQLYENTAGVSNTHRANKAIAEEQYNALSISLGVISNRMKALQEKLNTVPIPYTKTLSRFWK